MIEVVDKKKQIETLLDSLPISSETLKDTTYTLSILAGFIDEYNESQDEKKIPHSDLDSIQEEVTEIKEENKFLMKTVGSLEETVVNLETRLEDCEKSMIPKEEMVFETVTLRDIDYPTAKSEIIRYCKDADGKVYVSDVLRDLLIDPELIMKIMDELEEEGIIGEET